MWITPQIKYTEHIRLRHPNRWRRVSVCTSPKFACLQYIMIRTMLCCRWESATLVLFRLCLQVHWLADRDEKHNKTQQECIPVGCVPPAHWPYLVVSYGHPPPQLRDVISTGPLARGHPIRPLGFGFCWPGRAQTGHLSSNLNVLKNIKNQFFCVKMCTDYIRYWKMFIKQIIYSNEK